MSKVVAVPQSMTMKGGARISLDATALTSRSAPTSSGWASLMPMPRSTSRSPTISGGVLKYRLASCTRLKTASGTTLAMMQASISPGTRPFSPISWVSQTAYSSAVRLVSVEARHAPLSPSPSKTAKTKLVLPASMASSIGTQTSDGREMDIAGSDPPRAAWCLQNQGAIQIEIEKASGQYFGALANLQRLADPLCALQPSLANRGESALLPDLQPEGDRA